MRGKARARILKTIKDSCSWPFKIFRVKLDR
nr:MAG TPA: hypothetical protein [Caudoviricetes sp.]